MRIVQRDRRSRRVARRGVTLLEVLIALALLGLLSVAWIGLSLQSMHSVALYHAREVEVQGAARELARLAVWSGDQFRGRIGRTRQGEFLLTVRELAPSLYGVVVADTAHAAPLLRTAFYVRDTIRAAP